MNLLDAIHNRRSIRKFQQTPISKETLTALVDCARLAPYPANVQPLKFAIIDTPAHLEQIFACTKWAGYLENGTPSPSERPTAYLVILGDRSIKKGGDLQVETGAAGAAITLAAMEYGLGSCWLGALNRERIAEILHLPDSIVVLDVIALGYPAQESQAVPMRDGDSIRYYLDENGVLQVPKRNLADVLYSVSD